MTILFHDPIVAWLLVAGLASATGNLVTLVFLTRRCLNARKPD